MENDGEELYVKYSCNNGNNWIIYDYIDNKATSNDYNRNGQYNLESNCDHNNNILIRFEYHGNDEPDRVYIDNLYLYHSCNHPQQTLINDVFVYNNINLTCMYHSVFFGNNPK